MNSNSPGVAYEGKDLEAMSFAKNYHDWILSQFRPFLGRTVAEIGAGSGDISAMLLANAEIRELVAVEPSLEMFPRLQMRLGRDPRVQCRHAVFSDVYDQYPEFFDSAVYVNVLEHIREDAGELRYVWQSLKPGGHVCIFVPALSWLYSEFDASIAHYRRYHREPLQRLLRDAGFELIRVDYMDSIGIIPWLLVMKLLKGKLKPSNVALYDRWLVPIVRAMENRLSPPVGKNLIAVGRKPT